MTAKSRLWRRKLVRGGLTSGKPIFFLEQVDRLDAGFFGPACSKPPENLWRETSTGKPNIVDNLRFAKFKKLRACNATQDSFRRYARRTT